VEPPKKLELSVKNQPPAKASKVHRPMVCETPNWARKVQRFEPRLRSLEESY